MNGKVIFRGVMVLVLAAVFCGALALADRPGEPYPELTCLGVPILSEEAAAGLTSSSTEDYSEDLKFQGEHVAVDKEASVIYLSQKIGEDTAFQDLVGTLSIVLPGKNLCFAPDPQWQDLQEAVRSGHGFRLWVCGSGNSCREYKVVFTTLPVVYLYGQSVYTNENGKNVMFGQMVTVDPEKLDGSGAGIHTSYLQWHKRGGTTSAMPKAPWKLSLRNKDGNNKNMDLLGLGADDDWILNAMNREDSNVREKLFMDLWNEMAVHTDYNYPMSTGEYVEVLINGEYFGLYMLQRRVDDKYLSLGNSSILMKVNEIEDTSEYEFVSKVHGLDVPYDLMDAFFYEDNCEALVKENFVDVSLFLNLFSARDNINYKNMFYVFDPAEDGYEIRLIPWDTDMTMASFWGGSGVGFLYDYEGSLNYTARRRELKAMRAMYPDLDEDLSRRWSALREDILTEERITGLMDGYLSDIRESGAGIRDQEQWGLYYEGEDTPEKLYQFVGERLALLDEYYSIK